MFDKRIVYVSAQQSDVYWLEGGKLQGPKHFRMDQHGLGEFASFLNESKEMVTSIVVDIVEEEFRNETIPHLSGKDSDNFIERRLAQYYRTTSYRTSKILGREKHGRRDDKVIYTALTNPDVLTPWLDCLVRHKVPVDGIYSPSFISADLLKKLSLKHENLLLITQQKNSGVRQTFFNNKQLKLSRLVPVADLDSEQYADYVFSEIEKTRRYLTRLQLLPFNQTLDVALVSDASIINIVNQNNEDTDLTRLHTFTMNDMVAHVGVDEKDTRYSDKVLVQLAFNKVPAVDYSVRETRRYYSFQRARVAMYAVSAACFIFAFIWSSMNFIEGSLLQSYSGEALQSVKTIQFEYDKVVARTPKTPVDPEGLKESVDIAGALKENRAMPHPLFKTISKGLFGEESIKIEKLEWIVSSDPYATVDPNKSNVTRPVANSFSSSSDDNDLYQIVLIKGSIKRFKGNYRDAFTKINKFVGRLNRLNNVMNATTVKLPLDVNSASNLKGKTGERAGRYLSDFLLRAVIKVRRG